MSNKMVTPMVVANDNMISPMGISIGGDDERIFVVLYIMNDSDEASYTVVQGEDRLYEYLKDLLKENEVDVIKSRVLRDGVSFKKALSVYKYLKTIEDYKNDEEFSVDDYVPSGDTGTPEENVGLEPDLF